jgi:hypothetical protein
MIFRFGALLALLSILLSVSSAHTYQREARKARTMQSPPTNKRLVGSWAPEGGKPIVYRTEGTGKNPDGSRFRWRLEDDYLVARAIDRDGKAGPVVKIPIVFTRDGKEYRLLLESGARKVTFYKLDSKGQRYSGRTPAGRRYPPPRHLKPREEEETPPSVHRPEGARRPVNAAPGQANAKADRIEVGPNIQVSVSRSRISHGEVVLAADPQDPKRLLAASMFSPPPIDPAAVKLVVYASSDGGKTWRLSLERKAANPRNYADPTLAFGADGTAYFANLYGESLEAYRSAPEVQDKICVQVARSTDGGRTWQEPTRIPGFHDRPFLTVDTTTGTYAGRLYCATTSGLFVSTDGGQTFGNVCPLPRKPGYIGFSSGNPVVLSDGSVITLYMGVREDRTSPASAQTPSGYMAVRRSEDGGATFSEERFLAGFDFTRLHYTNIPTIAIAPGTAYRDRLYVVWTDALPDGKTGVMLARSEDRGVTWSSPVLLSEQRTGRAKQDSSQTYHAFLPCVAVNKAGIVGVSWYDTRGMPPGQAGWNLRFRTSLDGGETWLPSVRVTEVSTLYKRAKGQKEPAEKREVYIQPGHTAGIAADAEGVFHLLWVDRRTGLDQVFTTAIRIKE